MTSIALIILNLLMIIGVSWLVSYVIMRWSFSAKRNAKLVERYHNMPIAGLNSGAIILLSLGLAFIFSDISAVRSRAKASTLQEADALRTLGRMSLNIDPTVGAPLMASAREYTASVLEKEWPAMHRGSSYAIRSGVSSALPPLARMSDIVYSPESIAKLPTVTSMHLANLVSRIREQRLQRIDASDFGMGLRGYLLVALTLLATTVLLSMSMLTKPASQFISNFCLFFVTLAASYIAFLSQNPFFGLDAVTNIPLQEAFDRLNTMELTRKS
ncbi:bestrophin-like domain [Zwartia hollandica]